MQLEPWRLLAAQLLGDANPWVNVIPNEPCDNAEDPEPFDFTQDRLRRGAQASPDK